ncbi:MFS transporter [Gulosibacter molinativorax]|uniref:MFS transporter n=2 Tax=Gulosibacter molinativorax TaxID=256821 RepID=A0ABT7C7C5_9MICO|nr:MFS transporter [Gulosibacter molinativorax]
MLLAGIATFAQLYAPQALLPQIAESFQVTIAESSLMVSMGTGGLAIAVVPWSLVADRIGRKRTISIAVVAATLLGLLSTAMPTFELTLAVRFLEGIALGGVPAVAMAYINEEIHRSDAAVAGGTFVAGNTIGGLSGRIISGPVGEATGSWEIGFLAVAALSILASILFMLLTPQPRGFIPMGGTGSTLGQSIQLTLSNAWKHLRNPVLLALYTQPFLLMGGFVAIYNYLGYHLTKAPFFLPVWVSSLVFLAYLAGTFTSPFAGRLASQYGRKRMLLIFQSITWVGLAIMLVPNIVAIVSGLIILTAAFFGAHAITSGWSGSFPKFGRAQSTALYNLSYYIGSSVLGFVGGLFFQQWGWPGLVGMVGALFLIAFVIAATVLPGRPLQAARQA